MATISNTPRPGYVWDSTDNVWYPIGVGGHSHDMTGYATLTGTETLTNKTLTNPVIASVINNTLTSTTGDIIYASAANTPARLGIGSSAQVLTVASGIPSWATAATGAVTLISQQTVTGSAAATITFSSIPGTYKNLRIVYLAAGTTGSNMLMTFNSDSGAHYDRQQLRAYDISTLAAEALANTTAVLAMIGNTTAGNIGAGEAVFPNYAGTVLHKSYMTMGYSKFAATTGQVSVGLYGGAWRSTAAITTITLTMDGGSSYAIGSSFTLYGES